MEPTVHVLRCRSGMSVVVTFAFAFALAFASAGAGTALAADEHSSFDLAARVTLAMVERAAALAGEGVSLVLAGRTTSARLRRVTPDGVGADSSGLVMALSWGCGSRTAGGCGVRAAFGLSGARPPAGADGKAKTGFVRSA